MNVKRKIIKMVNMHGNKVLSAMSICGLIATAITSGIAGYKIANINDIDAVDKKECLKDKIKIILPPISCIVFTSYSIFLTNKLNSMQKKAIYEAYNHLRYIVKNGISKCAIDIPVEVMNGFDTVLIYDMVSSCYLEGNLHDLKSILDSISYKINTGNIMNVYDYLDRIGVRDTIYDDFGIWDIRNLDTNLFENFTFEIKKTILDDGLEVFVIFPNLMPELPY